MKNKTNSRVAIQASRLRVLQGGETNPRFLVLKAKEDFIRHDVEEMTVQELCDYSLFSANAKTSISLDFPIGHTCNPTALCASVCYAGSPRAAATWRKSLRKRLRNLRYFLLVSADEAAERMTNEFRREARRWSKRTTLDFLRVNGGGDLFPAVVPAINRFAELNPDIRVWIVTRQFGLARGIGEFPNIFLQLSLDRTTPPAFIGRAEDLVATHSRAYLSYLRTQSDDDTKGAAIVFNEKRTAGLPFNGRTDCPVDAGKLPLNNIRGVGGDACSRCRKCFSERTVDYAKANISASKKEGAER